MEAGRAKSRKWEIVNGEWQRAWGKKKDGPSATTPEDRRGKQGKWERRHRVVES